MGPLPRWLLLGAGGAATLLVASGQWLATARAPVAPGPAESRRPTVPEVEARNRDLERRLRALAPQGVHVVVDTAANRLYLKDGERVLREAVVSCGSGNVLRDPRGGQAWVFDTPRGEYRVESKVRKPIWMKPDWAFVEEGKEIPVDPAQRAERGVLGDYALGIGRGYFLHGTLYTRMLGRNVTHGCVRLADADLEALYRTVPRGAQVFLF